MVTTVGDHKSRGHSGCVYCSRWSQLSVVTTVVDHNCRWSKRHDHNSRGHTTVGGLNCRWSQLLLITTVGGQNVMITTVVAILQSVVATVGGHNCWLSQLSVITGRGQFISMYSYISVLSK